MCMIAEGRGARMRSLWLEWSFEQCANATSSLIAFFKALHLAAALCACTGSWPESIQPCQGTDGKSLGQT